MSQSLYHATLPCPYSALEAFLRLRGCAGCVWLDSARSNPHGDARFSLIAADPLSRLRFVDGRLERIDYHITAADSLPPTNAAACGRQTPPSTDAASADPLAALEQWLDGFGRTDVTATTDALAFFGGGAIGYFSYELGRQWERYQPLPRAAEHFPQMDWALYDRAVVCDSLCDTVQVVACSCLSEADAQQKAHALLALLQQPVAASPATAPAPPESHVGNASSSEARCAAYVQAVEKTRAYIAAGDIYQANIAQHFDAPLREPAADLYLRLRELNPAPYAAYLDTGAFQILSSSPELFLQKRGNHVRTRPIKGTRPRGKDAQADARLCAELLSSEKERAELLMIVDLERNDLGRVCEPGSVRVESLYRIESYATVHHLVADVCGTLKSNTGLGGLLRATFPGGSITGAPKVRAMEIIDELENRERGIFCGAIGVIGLNGSLDLNIAIRTLLCSQDGNSRRVQASVGAGLVWDSDPQKEYEETLHKAEALLKAINNQAAH